VTIEERKKGRKKGDDSYPRKKFNPSAAAKLLQLYIFIY
jgi:hypothetical protein